MKKAIYLRLVALSFLAILLSSLLTAGIVSSGHRERMQQLLKQAAVLAGGYDFTKHPPAPEQWGGAGEPLRLLLFSANEQILWDSSPDWNPSSTLSLLTLSPAAQTAVRQAKQDQVSLTEESGGFSLFTGDRRYAVIKRADDQVVLLIHHDLGLLQAPSTQLLLGTILLLLTALLSLALSRRVAKNVSQPLEQLVDTLATYEYDKLEDCPSGYYEVDKVVQSVQGLLQQVSESNEILLSERQKINYILSNMTEGFVLVDEEKNILLCNQSAQDYFGTQQPVLHTHIMRLTRSKKIEAALDQALEQRTASGFDLTLSDDRIVNVYVSPAREKEVEFGAMILLVDRTTEKRLELQKRDFFENASHELKTPVTSILGFAEMLGQGMLSSKKEQKVAVDRIVIEAKRLSSMVNDILMISELETQNFTYPYDTFDFGALLQDVVRDLAPMKEEMGVTLTLDAPRLLVCANRKHLYRLSVNLIENAYKYNQKNGKIQVTLEEKDADVRLTVSDTGIGIPLLHQDRVFERFYRINYGQHKRVSGTGLGLAIVKHIVGDYQGKISLTSKLDRGTTVAVTLPIVSPSITWETDGDDDFTVPLRELPS